MHAQVGTNSRTVSLGMYESLLHGNREMHRTAPVSAPHAPACTGNTSRNPRKSLTALETTNERCDERKANLSG